MIYPDNRPHLTSRLRATLTAVAWALLAIALLAALLFARQVQAATGPAQTLIVSSLEDDEVEAEEESEDEGDEEEEFEEVEEVGSVGPLLLPPECLLHTAEAQVAASASHGTVRLTIHYTSYTPADVTVDYWLKGGKGSLHLGETKRHFGRQGVFRAEERLGDRAMSKVLAARIFVVQLDVGAAPSFCDRYSTQRLTSKHAASGHATWSRPR